METPSLLKVSQTQGEGTVRVILYKLMAEASLSFNVGKNMNDNQLWEATGLVLKEFQDLKIPDIKLCLNRAKTGRYGKSYDRVDVQVICDWISQYDLERMEEISQAQEKAASNQKIKIPEIDKKVTDAIKTVIEKIPEVKEQRGADETSYWFNKFYRQFDICFKKWGTKGAIRFVTRYGKTMDGLEFCEYKFKQLERVSK